MYKLPAMTYNMFLHIPQYISTESKLTMLMQISDFGLAKLMSEGQETHVTARVLGTFGYFDPEYTSV